MEQLALIGVSHRRGGVEAIEIWQRHLANTPWSFWRALGFEEMVPISTCNRCDIVLALGGNMTTSEAKRALSPSDWPQCYAYQGEGALEQLARVASSLDSLNPGEDQIMMQVRDAFAQAESDESVGPQTRFAFTTAFRIAKRVRREVELAPLHTSLFSLAKPEMEPYLPKFAHVGILGTGKIGALAARSMQDRPHTELLLINRDISRAQALASTLKAKNQVVSLDDFLLQPTALDALICATSAMHLVDGALLAKLPQLRVIVDLGIPRNVEPKAAKRDGLVIFDVDTLQEAGQLRRCQIEENLIRAEEILLAELDLAVSEWIERQLSPAICHLQERYLATIGESIPKDEAKRLAHRFASIPIKGLRTLARIYGIDAAKAFLDASEWR